MGRTLVAGLRSVCAGLVLFQGPGAPGRKRKASMSLTDDEGLSWGPLLSPLQGPELTRRAPAHGDHDQELLGPLLAGRLGAGGLERWPVEQGAPGTEGALCSRGRGRRGEGVACWARPQVARAVPRARMAEDGCVLLGVLMDASVPRASLLE